MTPVAARPKYWIRVLLESTRSKLGGSAFVVASSAPPGGRVDDWGDDDAPDMRLVVSSTEAASAAVAADVSRMLGRASRSESIKNDAGRKMDGVDAVPMPELASLLEEHSSGAGALSSAAVGDAADVWLFNPSASSSFFR